METYQFVLLVIAAALVVEALALFVAAGGDFERVRSSVRSAWRSLRDAEFTQQVGALLDPPAASAETNKPSGVPLRLLSVLQREGRIVDFLLEDIQSYSDDQIGAAVRDIHRQCQAALKEHLVLAPVVPQAEGDSIEVPRGFDPSSIRLSGNVTGEPPFRGTLRHHGWRVVEIKLAEPPPGQDEQVLMPAEVELP
jgi:hypothetical protein